MDRFLFMKKDGLNLKVCSIFVFNLLNIVIVCIKYRDNLKCLLRVRFLKSICIKYNFLLFKVLDIYFIYRVFNIVCWI